jgi:hypothetical protein
VFGGPWLSEWVVIGIGVQQLALMVRAVVVRAVPPGRGHAQRRENDQCKQCVELPYGWSPFVSYCWCGSASPTAGAGVPKGRTPGRFILFSVGVTKPCPLSGSALELNLAFE